MESEVDDVYLVSERLERVDDADIDRLEEDLGVLPRGYRDYVTRFGVGTYVDTLCIERPSQVLARTNGAREIPDTLRVPRTRALFDDLRSDG